MPTDDLLQMVQSVFGSSPGLDLWSSLSLVTLHV